MRRAASTILMALLFSPVATASSNAAPSEIVLSAGRPLRVALDHRVTIARVGQVITATVVDAVYARDRVVIPAGTRARGRVVSFADASKSDRARKMLGGSFTSLRRAVLAFDTLIMADGRELAMETIVGAGVAGFRRRVAASPDAAAAVSEATGPSARARRAIARSVDDVRQRGRDAIDAVARPGRLERLRDAATRALPYYRPFFSKGTIFEATLVAPVSFGAAEPLLLAPQGSTPVPGSILSARLVTALDSKATLRGTPIEAVLSEPVFSASGEVILLEGTRLTGEVTYAKPARRFRRSGQLRFLFDTVHASEAPSRALLASLHAVHSAEGGLALDEEGGASVSNAKTRFLAPALAIAALHGHQHHVDAGGEVAGSAAVTPGSMSARGFGSFLGFGVVGLGIGRLSPPAGLALATVGAARTTYRNLFGKGAEVSFPAATPIELQMAPGPRSAK